MWWWSVLFLLMRYMSAQVYNDCRRGVETLFPNLVRRLLTQWQLIRAWGMKRGGHKVLLSTNHNTSQECVMTIPALTQLHRETANASVLDTVSWGDHFNTDGAPIGVTLVPAGLSQFCDRHTDSSSVGTRMYNQKNATLSQRKNELNKTSLFLKTSLKILI